MIIVVIEPALRLKFLFPGVWNGINQSEQFCKRKSFANFLA